MWALIIETWKILYGLSPLGNCTVSLNLAGNEKICPLLIHIKQAWKVN